MKSILSTVAALLLSATASLAQSFDHSHAAFTGVLKTHVQGSKVDYAALKKSPAVLNGYLDTLAAVRKPEYDGWKKDQRMAYLINLYNAATLKLVIDHYPVKSIKNIGGVFRSPWKQNVVRLFGKKVTLDHVEHDLLRPHFNEPRIHFAINCASIGCPDLRSEAFRAADLNRQLEEQTRAFLRDTSRNKLDAKNRTLHLSSIFKWFKEDFVKKSGSVERFIFPYFNEADKAIIQKGGLRIRHNNYDWNLNKR